MLYLITCSDRKDEHIVGQKSSLDALSFPELQEARQKIIAIYGEENIDWTNCVPAHSLYKGVLYTNGKAHLWSSDQDIFIFSSLFGWIRYTDLVPYYKLPITTPVKHHWVKYRKILQDIISIYPQKTDLLFQKDREIITGGRLIYAGNLAPNEIYNDRGHNRGTWLAQQIVNLKP